MNADNKVVIAVITDVNKLEAIANFVDGAVIKYAAGIQFETLRDSFEYAHPSRTLIPFKVGSEGYTTFGANSCFILYK